MRIDGGLVPQHRWLWYDADGTARLDGVVAPQRGRFRSNVDYAKVERLLAGAELCTRTYRLSVRCGDGWRLFTTYDASEPAPDAQIRETVRSLQRLAANLTWESTNEAVELPDNALMLTRAETPPAPG